MLASFTSNPRVPCPPGQVLKRLLGRLMSGCALLLCVGFSGAALADDFDELIRRLGNDNWEERDAAERAIKKIALTKAQFARLAERLSGAMRIEWMVYSMLVWSSWPRDASSCFFDA